MNRIDRLFRQKKKEIFSVYCTAGFPQLNDTVPMIRALANGGADMIEIGIPFSDPVADGPVIQQSNERALANGMTLSLLLGQLATIREITDIPLLLMGYWNPVLQYGVEAFCKDAAAAGIDGVIIPDLPVAIYERDYAAVFEQYGLHFVLLVTPATSSERILMLNEKTGGFMYAVSANAVTGNVMSASGQRSAYYSRLAALPLRKPFLVGFGIHDHSTYMDACAVASGAITGSHFIRFLEQQECISDTAIAQFIKNIKHDH